MSLPRDVDHGGRLGILEDDVREALAADARVDALEARGHAAGLAEQRPNHVHEVHAVFEQHAAFGLRFERLGRLPRVVLRQVQEAAPAEESLAMPPQDVAKPGPVGMVLVDQEQAVVIAQLGHERPRVLQPIAERLLTDDVRAGPRGSQAVLAMEPRRREDVHEIERRSAWFADSPSKTRPASCKDSRPGANRARRSSARSLTGSTSATISTSGIRCQPRRWNSEIMPHPTTAPRSFIRAECRPARRSRRTGTGAAWS